MALKSTSTLNEAILTFDCKDAESGEGFNRVVDLAKLFGSVGALTLAAIAFAAKTALRNATGGREVDEVEEAVDARIKAWNDGEWGAERSASGEAAPFTAGNILAKAVQRVYASKFTTAVLAAAALSDMLSAQLAALPEPAVWDDLTEENQRKARNAFTKAARTKDSAVDSAIAAIQAEQAASRAAKKANPAGGASLF